MELTLRGKKSTVHAGDTLTFLPTLHINFTTLPLRPVRMLCICSPAGQEKFFIEVGCTGRHAHDAHPPKLNEKEEAAFIEKVKMLAPKYSTELLREPYGGTNTTATAC